MEQRKVYDSDVQTVPLLASIAEQYALDYVGDFPMMIEAKKCLLAGGTLPGASVRAVLNTLRYDVARADLQAAVSAVLRHPSTPPPEDMAQVIAFDKAQRNRERERRNAERDEKERRSRPVFLRLEDHQFQVKAPFATAVTRSGKAVLHWVRPTGHEAEWRLPWGRIGHENGWDQHQACDTVTAKGNGYPREFRLTLRTFCKAMTSGYHMLWTERPLESDVWPEKGADRFLPDCRGCLRNIGLEYMDCYPPDRLESGEYPEGWRA